MKAIDVIRDKGDVAGKAFSAAKTKIVSLVEMRSIASRKKQPEITSSPLPSTAAMPANVSKAINSAVEEKLASLATSPLADAQSNTIAGMIAGSGLKPRRRR